MNPKALAVKEDKNKELVNRKISLRRLIVGGAAMLPAAIKNHQNVKAGNNLSNPFVKQILRVWVVSYVIFAKANKAEEHSPCAIIKAIAPCHPQAELDMAPTVSSPIWPTLE